MDAEKETEKGIASLLTDLCEPEAPLQAALIYRLSEPSKGDLEILQASWASIPVERKRLLLSRLVETSEANFEVNFTTVALFALEDEDVEVRCHAIAALWESEEPEIMRRFVFMLRSSTSTEVRAAAAQALGPFILAGELESLPKAIVQEAEDILLAVCQAEDEPLEVYRRALESIAYSSHEHIAALIEKAAKHQDQKLQASALFAMGRNADQRWEKQILDAVRHPEPELRFEAIRAAGELGLIATIPHLIAMLGESDREIKEAAIWSLGEIGGEEAQQALLELADREDDESLLEAIEDAINMATLAMGDFATYLFMPDEDDE